jgi:hypothetical protein
MLKVWFITYLQKKGEQRKAKQQAITGKMKYIGNSDRGSKENN